MLCLYRMAIIFKFSFSQTFASLQFQLFVSGIAKSNIDNSYPLTKYGNKTCDVNIFQDIYKTISFSHKFDSFS